LFAGRPGSRRRSKAEDAGAFGLLGKKGGRPGGKKKRSHTYARKANGLGFCIESGKGKPNLAGKEETAAGFLARTNREKTNQRSPIRCGGYKKRE